MTEKLQRSGFDDKTIPLPERLRECAELDAAEGCEPSVVAMMLEAADEIEKLKQENAYLREQIACASNALTDSILVSGNDVETNLHWVRRLKKIGTDSAGLATILLKKEKRDV